MGSGASRQLLTLLASAAASAQGESELVSLVNAYRAEPQSCNGKKLPAAGVLSPAPVLARVPPSTGADLTGALRDAGYHASRAFVIAVVGPSSAASVMAQLTQRFCASLLDQRVSEIGIAREGERWQILLAQPLVSNDLGTWQETAKPSSGSEPRPGASQVVRR